MITSELVLNMEVRTLILHTLHWIATVIEIIGVAVIILGVIAASAWAVRSVYAGEWKDWQHHCRGLFQMPIAA